MRGYLSLPTGQLKFKQLNTFTTHDFEGILANFCMAGFACEIVPYGSGHINTTFHIKNGDITAPDYLLQRINSHIFKDVPSLIENINTVSGHLRNKLFPIYGDETEQRVLTLVETKNHQYYFEDGNENFWRLYLYLKNTNSYDVIETENQAFQAGSAFGKFQSLLADLDPKALTETIPDFYNLENRLNNFQRALNEGVKDRVRECFNEIRYINEHASAMCTTFRFGKNMLPLRITHNDTKFNNVLFDKNDIAQCIIDLDTVMPGYLAYDFGDAMRTVANTAAEDEQDLNKIDINISLFEAYTNGYLNEAMSFLTNIEIDSLTDWVLLVTYMQAVRFLTDYIEGDKYYKVHFPAHNLQRTRAQIALLEKLLANYDILNNIVQNKVLMYKALDDSSNEETIIGLG